MTTKMLPGIVCHYLENLSWTERTNRVLFFFFQAEDGIRDLTVTGVQTCVLPIFEVNDLTEAVLGYAVDPDVVAFGSACPAPELFQLERVRRALSSNARRDRDSLGRYGLPPGTERLRRAIARRALEWGCRIDHRNLVTTSGCMEAI